VRIHSWLGLGIGAVFSLAGLTGSALVFDHRIDEWLNPDLLLHESQGTRVPLEAMVEVASAGGRRVTSLHWPRVPRGAFVVEAMDGTSAGSGAPEPWQIGIDPVEGRVLGERPASGHLISIVYDLHHTFLLGRPGEILLGILSVFMLASLITGLYLWWPRRRRLKQALRIKTDASPRRIAFDLHRTAGFYSFLVLTVLLITGFYLVFSGSLKPVVDRVLPLTPVPAGLKAAEVRPGLDRLSADEIVDQARTVFPRATVEFLHFPSGPEGVFHVAMRQPGEVRRSGALSGVAIDPYNGSVLAKIDSREMTAGDILLAWQFPLHNGEVFGLAGRWVVFFSGLVPLILYGTGLSFWLRKRRTRRRARVIVAGAANRSQGGDSSG